MTRLLAALGLVLFLAGCGSSASTSTQTTATVTTSPPTAVPPTAGRQIRPTPTVTIGRSYASFLTSLCSGLRGGDVAGVTARLPNYQYNTGVRYGYMGDGEGQTGDPSILRSWLPGHHIRCEYFVPDSAGHGVVLTSGWTVSRGPWSLVEMDVFNGQWKINDFTFGARDLLYHTMLATVRPVLAFGGSEIRG